MKQLSIFANSGIKRTVKIFLNFNGRRAIGDGWSKHGRLGIISMFQRKIKLIDIGIRRGDLKKWDSRNSR
jgi:hypothetical protein